VAVAANLCSIAIGTETDGSITCPASTNGIVGIKPTIGFASRSGIIPISFTQDTAGPMGRTVADVAAVLGFLAGKDESDPSTAQGRNKTEVDYTRFLDAGALRGKRIGVEKKQQGNNHFMHALEQKARSILEQNGATIVEIEYLDQINEASDAEFELMKFEFRDGLNKYLSATDAPVKSLSELIAFNLKNQDKAMPYFKQEILESAESKAGLDSIEYKAAFEKSHVRCKGIIDNTLANHQLDAICGLTMGPACSIDTIYGDRWGEVFLTMPAAVSGYPHISVPAGMIYALPVGLSFFGAPFSEGKLISIAFAYEQASKNRQLPGFRQSFFE
jgi:amidase